MRDVTIVRGQGTPLDRQSYLAHRCQPPHRQPAQRLARCNLGHQDALDHPLPSLALLLVLIAAALAWNHFGNLHTLTLPGSAPILGGVLAGATIGVVAALMGVAGGELLIPTIVGGGGLLLGAVPNALLIPLLIALVLASAIKVWRHN